MGWDNIHQQFGQQLPAGEFKAWLDGGKVETTQEVARAVFCERHNAGPDGASLLASAESFFASGRDGTTQDEFYESVLRAFGRPVPEYPAELRAKHDERAALFWGGVARQQSRAVEAMATTPAMVAALESGHQQADRD